MEQDDQALSYCVVVNAEEQFSIWPQGRDLPPGWSSVGTTGNKAECIAYIKEHWVDMRPRSLRQAMDTAT